MLGKLHLRLLYQRRQISVSHKGISKQRRCSDIALGSLKEKYTSQDALRIFGTYTRGRLALVPELGNKLGLSIPPNEEPVEEVESLQDGLDTEMDLDELSSFFEKTASGLVQNALAGLSGEDDAQAAMTEADGMTNHSINGVSDAERAPGPSNVKIDLTDYKELEALVAESTSNYVKTTLHGLSPVPYQPTVPTSTSELIALRELDGIGD